MSSAAKDQIHLEEFFYKLDLCIVETVTLSNSGCLS